MLGHSVSLRPIYINMGRKAANNNKRESGSEASREKLFWSQKVLEIKEKKSYLAVRHAGFWQWRGNTIKKEERWWRDTERSFRDGCSTRGGSSPRDTLLGQDKNKHVFKSQIAAANKYEDKWIKWLPFSAVFRMESLKEPSKVQSSRSALFALASNKCPCWKKCTLFNDS